MTPARRISLALTFLLAAVSVISSRDARAQQDVRKVFTNYGGFWSSSADSVSPVRPDNSHMVLGFEYKTRIFSTGVADTALIHRNISFTGATFQSFLLATNAIPATISTKIGVGMQYGGAGNVSPVPVSNELTQYLSDGSQGLDLGTALFNIPGGQMRYKVTNINSSYISDGIPDVLVTQVGAPPAASIRDTFRFEDSLGNVIGNAVSISMANIAIIGHGSWKFYDPGTPCSYSANLQGDRPLRMMAFELSDFGLNIKNIGRIARFVHRVSGESDQAFVAYNTAAFTVDRGSVLPVTLEAFNARKVAGSAQLDWSMSEARQFSHFEIERSATGAAYEKLGAVYPEAGAIRGAYSFTDVQPAPGMNRYRLRMIDLDGAFSYSAVQSLSFSAQSAASLYPNPASSHVYVQSTGAAMIEVMSVTGAQVPAPVSTEGSRSRIDLNALPAGLYIVRIHDAAGVQSLRLSVSY